MSNQLSVLAILDGFGYSGQAEGNAIFEAKTPMLDYLWSNFPSYLLKAAEEEVGLEFGEIGNSEVGHMTIGTGRVIPQALNRINKAIDDGSFYKNQILNQILLEAKNNNTNVHLMGIISSSGVHGHLFHFTAMMQLAAQIGVKNLFLHLILDGRDAGKFDSPLFLREIESTRKSIHLGTYASIVGRAYAMDRNGDWATTQRFYNLLFGQAEKTFSEPSEAINSYYQQGIDDENIPPTLINKDKATYIQPNDTIIFTNFREDRARQITQALIDPSFDAFKRLVDPSQLTMVTMTQYKKGLPTQVVFPPPVITNTLSDVLSNNSLNQIHIGETEKYGHVTYFFNGGREDKAPGEEYFLVPSLKPEEFTTKPEMSAQKITEAILKSIDLGYDFIVFNFANCDMVGHTGDYQATVRAVEVVDGLLKQIVDHVWAKNGNMYITADHGNSEQMKNPKTGEIYKKHTIAPVPFIIASKDLYTPSETIKVMSDGQISGLLSDIAPTILKHLELYIPEEMTGKSLI